MFELLISNTEFTRPFSIVLFCFYILFFIYSLSFTENDPLTVFGYVFQEKNRTFVSLKIQEKIIYAQNKHILVGRTMKFSFQCPQLNYECILSLTAHDNCNQRVLKTTAKQKGKELNVGLCGIAFSIKQLKTRLLRST